MSLDVSLEIKNNIECPICYEENQECVKYMNCSHFVCINCYKKQIYPKELEQPLFPYDSDIKDDYDEDQENPKWKLEYPLIDKYNEEYIKWSQKECEISGQAFSKKCPICREPVVRKLHHLLSA